MVQMIDVVEGLLVHIQVHGSIPCKLKVDDQYIQVCGSYGKSPLTIYA